QNLALLLLLLRLSLLSMKTMRMKTFMMIHFHLMNSATHRCYSVTTGESKSMSSAWCHQGGEPGLPHRDI
ncbi:uncharacterized protein WCI35_023153, partial [Daubentonia madagascariensis]